MSCFHVLFLCLSILLLPSLSSGQEAGQENPEKAEAAASKRSASVSSVTDLSMQGLWVVEDQEGGMEHFRMGMELDSVRISKDGTKFLIEIIGGRPGQYRTLAIRDGDQLKTGILFLGDITFADDGQRAYFGGSEFRKVPDHKVREYIEDQGVAKIRAQCIMNVRNCQQAMRGEQNMKQLNPGDPFTKADLEEYMKFPEDIKIDGGVITFKPGNVVTKEGGDPPANGDHLWLKIVAPDTIDNVGKYGFKKIEETAGW